LLFGILGNAFTWQIFVTQAFLNAVPGIIMQLMFIPTIVISVRKREGDVQERKGEKLKKSGSV